MEKDLFDKMKDEKAMTAMTPEEFAETMRKQVESYWDDREIFRLAAFGQLLQPIKALCVIDI